MQHKSKSEPQRWQQPQLSCWLIKGRGNLETKITWLAFGILIPWYVDAVICIKCPLRLVKGHLWHMYNRGCMGRVTRRCCCQGYGLFPNQLCNVQEAIYGVPAWRQLSTCNNTFLRETWQLCAPSRGEKNNHDERGRSPDGNLKMENNLNPNLPQDRDGIHSWCKEEMWGNQCWSFPLSFGRCHSWMVRESSSWCVTFPVDSPSIPIPSKFLQRRGEKWNHRATIFWPKWHFQQQPRRDNIICPSQYMN